jgi:hypothetical protein
LNFLYLMMRAARFSSSVFALLKSITPGVYLALRRFTMGALTLRKMRYPQKGQRNDM